MNAQAERRQAIRGVQRAVRRILAPWGIRFSTANVEAALDALPASHRGSCALYPDGTPAGSISVQIATQAAEAAIDLFLEYRDSHGYDEDRARVAAINEVIEGETARIEELWRS